MVDIISDVTTDFSSLINAVGYLKDVDWGGISTAVSPAPIPPPQKPESQFSEAVNVAAPIFNGLDDALKAIGLFVPPVAIAASDLDAILAGVKILAGLSNARFIIPQVTIDTEDAIDDRFENTFKVSK